MRNSLKEGLSIHYKNKTLSPEKISVLMDAQKRFNWFSIDWRLGASLSIIIVIACTAMVFSFKQTSLHDRIAKEVRYNHRKGMPSEVLSNDYTLINEALDKLDFNIRQSNQLGANLVVIGARYCSIQGKIAAQIQLRHLKTGKRLTLYQFKAGDEVYEKELVKEETRIKIWKESDGMGFVLAEDIDPK